MSDLATAIAIADIWRQPQRWRNLAIAVQAWRDAKQQRDEHLQLCGRDEYAIMLHQTVEEYRKQILGLHDEFQKIDDYLQNNYCPNLITALPAIDWPNYEPGREEEHANQMRVVFEGLLARKAEAMNTGDRQTPRAGRGEATEPAESVGETKTKQSTEQGEGEPGDGVQDTTGDCMARLLSLCTNGISDESLLKAVEVLRNPSLSSDEKLNRLSTLKLIPPDTSAQKLATMLGVSKQAVLKTPWWGRNRRGRDTEDIEDRRSRMLERGRQYERHDAEGW